MIKCLSLTGLILIALEGITTGAIVAQNRDHYGAIATSTTNPAIWGYSHDYPTLAQAQRYALEYCGQADCQIRVWFKNGCGAIATNGSNIGSAWAVNRSKLRRVQLSPVVKETVKLRSGLVQPILTLKLLFHSFGSESNFNPAATGVRGAVNRSIISRSLI
ncbi:DUF4189 domain-containing protein [Arthrospira platensis BEA 1257B]